MKKLFLLTVLCALVGTAAFGATVHRTILSHEGVLTQYDLSNWQGAITDAVDGDIVYFTSGTFSGDPLTINKRIALIGAGVAKDDCFYKDVYGDYCTTGESTFLNVSIVIDIEGATKLDRPLMEGIAVTDCHQLEIKQAPAETTFKRCQFIYDRNISSTGFFASSEVSGLILENCYFGKLDFNNMVNPTIRNCYVDLLDNARAETKFFNCIIVTISGCTNCYFTNCGYQSLWSSSYNTFVNCLYGGWSQDANSTYENCINDGDFNGYTKAQLLEKNYLGNDGSVIGPLGGNYPFTLIPSQPSVQTNSINYDNSKKQLNVNLTIKQGK